MCLHFFYVRVLIEKVSTVLRPSIHHGDDLFHLKPRKLAINGQTQRSMDDRAAAPLGEVSGLF